MNKVVSAILKISICFILGTISLFFIKISTTSSAENGFTENLLLFIDSHSRQNEGIILHQSNIIKESQEEEPDIQPFAYKKGDWNKYVIKPKYTLSQDESGQFYTEKEQYNLEAYGSYKLDMLYGKSAFTSNKYKRSDDDKATSGLVKDGFNLERQLQLHMIGNMGKRTSVYIDYDSQKEDNTYVMQYKAQNSDEIIREINAGQIDIKFEGSKYAVYDENTAKGMGIDLTLQKENLYLKAFGSIARGETITENFRGNTASGYIKLEDYQYLTKTYYQLEPYKRYDNRTTAPTPLDDPYNTLITFTSNPTDPESYRPYMVNVSSSGFELYMDDQNSNNYSNLNSITLSIDGGYYDKLVSGTDYTINFSTGLITFLKTVPKNSRIFAVYTLSGGSISTSDPAARTDVAEFNGKIFVFIKYGPSINEDMNNDFILNSGENKNNDDRLNVDVYEVKSFYSIGQKQLSSDNFKIQIFKQNSIMPKSDTIKTGKFTIDYTNGLIMFYLREPFKELYVDSGNSASLNYIYSENQPDSVNTYSDYNLRVDYYREARTFQLQHTNIIPGSVRIKINGRVIPDSLYSVDYTSGFLQFIDPNNPAIASETGIEVKYEYLPAGQKTSTLDTGLRVEYKINKNLKIGSTILFSRQSASQVIPIIGSEPSETLVLESDASLHLEESSLKELIKKFTGFSPESVPLDIRSYAEYARSSKKVNTFGKTLIDDMESNENVFNLSMSDKDWQLSSMPYNTTPGDILQTERGQIFYYYYRDLSNPGKLMGTDFIPYSIPYSNKPGPYNVATGHIDNSIQKFDTQKSIVFNFDFSTGDYIPVITRKLSTDTVDLSGLEYIEIWYKSDGGTGNVDLFFDIGSLNEDADDDGILDTEDTNNNGILDYDSSSSEDTGFIFNPAGGTSTRIGSGPGLSSFTMGDGVLNTEDLNGNGTLETPENRIRLPGTMTTPNNVTVDMSDLTWQKARIYLDKSSADYLSNSAYYEELLKEVQSIRFFLRNSSALTGTIYIDSIKLVSSIWGNIMLNDIAANSPTEFSLTLVDTLNDSDYRSNSFMLQQSNVYESLYGNKSGSELNSQKETAIQIDYDLSLVSNKGSVTKTFTKPMDFRSYKTMNIWLNYRSFTAGDTVTILIGSSDSNYIPYTFEMDYPGIWREIKLKLKSDSTGNIEKSPVVGNPDMKRISFIRVEINGVSGKIWMDDIYLSEPEKQNDGAYWYEGELKITRPLFYTNSGKPAFSNIGLKYISKWHGSKFNTIGQSMNDIMEKYNELFSSVNILPNWETKLDFILENSETESFNELVPADKRGKTDKNSLIFESNYISDIFALPTIKLLYKQDLYNNTKVENSTSGLKADTKKNIYTPSLILEERLSGFLWGNLTTLIKINLFFGDELISRNDPSYTDEIEKREKEIADISIDYQNKYFYLQPAIYTGSHEIVEYKGKNNINDTQITSDFNGGFHFPMFYGNGSKLVDRQKKANLKLGSNGRIFLSPNMAWEFFYSENNFNDYSISERLLTEEFSRSKNAITTLSNGLNFPFHLYNYKSLKFIKSFNIFYTRSIYCEEKYIPYEGESTSSFDERYGIDRVFNKFSNPVFNLFDYPPWHFFQGRGNFANGRDYCNSSLNYKLGNSSDSVIQNYDNHIKLIDNTGFSSLFDVEIFVINFDGSINQVSEREAVSGIPREVISINLNSGINLDLMQIFSFGFFRQNKIGIPHHSANINFNYSFAKNMLITSNIEEVTQSPGIGLTFKWDRSNLGLKTELNLRQRNDKEYISLNEQDRSRSDDLYAGNINSSKPFKEKDKGYKFSIFYETDVLWLYNFFSNLYQLTGYPIFNIEYSLILNRYDYLNSTSPEPYDQHLITGKLTLDLHKNVQGGISGIMGLEKYRNRDTDNVSREIISYQLLLNFTLIF